VLAAAADQLAPALEHSRLASFYRSAPVSALAQPPYLNTVLVGWTRLAPDQLLALAKRLERRAGRVAGPRGGPRPLDIDLLVYGDLVADAPELTLPHPRLRSRRFVLAPLAEVAPGLRLPPDGRPVSEILAEVGQESQVERLL
jgi:2-amino-4-hydroxy-6-hydroxymethyldihydropteridine diphosphokinase